jgi:hypothetical protein
METETLGGIAPAVDPPTARLQNGFDVRPLHVVEPLIAAPIK